METNFDVACGLVICAKRYLLIVEPIAITAVAVAVWTLGRWVRHR